MKAGIGYDVHRLEPGRKLILGGVQIPFEKGLQGHSDADVLLHAVMDALLGAAGLKDIGTYFPDSDPAYEGISSLLLLKKTRELIAGAGYKVGNVDAVIIAQAPKMAAYIDQMRDNIARTLGTDPSCISVKATTTEHLGFAGRGEGIGAEAVCLLEEIRK